MTQNTESPDTPGGFKQRFDPSPHLIHKHTRTRHIKTMDQLVIKILETCPRLDPPELLAEGGLFLWSGARTDQVSPDLQYFCGPVQFVAPEYLTDGPGFTFAPVPSQPRSRER